MGGNKIQDKSDELMDAMSIQTIGNLGQEKLSSPKLLKFQKSGEEEETLMVIDLSKANGEKASIAIGANS